MRVISDILFRTTTFSDIVRMELQLTANLMIYC